MGSALEINPDIGLRELLQISQSNQWSVQYSPFSHSAGGRQGATIIREAAPWKGVNGMEELREVAPDVAAGLEEAKSMANATKNTSGLAVIEKGGEAKIVSQAAAELAEAGGQNWNVVEQGLRSYSEAVQELTAAGYPRPALPSVA